MVSLPKITIITASYNYAAYISETIESVINQTYPNWEMVIVDDGSTDNSVDIINSYCKKDNRIKLYQHKNCRNRGLRDTLKLALKHAHTDWVAFVESDDIITPNYLEEKIKVIQENPEVKFIFNNYETIGNINCQNKSYYDNLNKKMSAKVGFYDYSEEFYRENAVQTFSIVMLKKELFNNVDFNSPMKNRLDWFLWGQISKKTKFYYIHQKLTFWRKHSTSYTYRSKRFEKLKVFIFFLKLGLHLPNIYKKKFMRFAILFKIL